MGMCLKENYSDSPSNEYSRHYSAESEYLYRQDMNSKSGEEQKKSHHVRRSPNFDSNFGYRAKKGQNDDALILGLDSAHSHILVGLHYVYLNMCNVHYVILCKLVVPADLIQPFEINYSNYVRLSWQFSLNCEELVLNHVVFITR